MPDLSFLMNALGGQQPQPMEPMNEKQKLQAMQLQQLQQASQQFAPRLNQVLDLGTHIGMPVESPASQMTKLLLMMRRMNPQGMQPAMNNNDH